MNNFDSWQPGASLEYVGGSYDLQNIFASARYGKEENRNQFTYAHNQSDGYRVQTNMRRDNFSWQSQLNVSGKQQITASVLFTDMYYQTPGALNLAEYNANPKAARPAGGGFPSAVAAKAAIWQKNILAGFTNQYQFTENFRNTTSLYGAYAQIRNAAIRNFERRKEPQFGGRTVFHFTKQNRNINWQWVAGAEYQQGYFNTQVADNRNGNPDTLRTNDDINNTSYNVFAQGDMSIDNKWFITAGLSLNKTKVSFSRLSRYPVSKQTRTYQNELAPRVSILRKLNKDLALLATVSRGFSPPTIAEVLPSTGVISTDLEAEQGWNYEATIRYALFKRKLQLEATGFYFRLNEALVQRRDQSGADYFVNAGDIRQKGIELNADYTYTPNHKKIIDHLTIQAAYSYSHFRYGSFIKGTDNFSGKTVPSVPENISSILADLHFSNGLYTNATYYSASKIFLNDANTVTAKAYELLGWRLGWKKTWQKKYKLNFYIGADNLLDEKYSLGNDINAAAGRYYNAAPRRNYYAGLALQWIKR
ncbi:MAG TPA: TonB-dependent receptor [Chitinophagaceae bacterium]